VSSWQWWEFMVVGGKTGFPEILIDTGTVLGHPGYRSSPDNAIPHFLENNTGGLSMPIKRKRRNWNTPSV